MAKNRKRGRGGGGLTIIALVIGIPAAVVIADYTVLKGKLGIASILCRSLKVGCGNVPTRLEYKESETTPGSLSGAGNPGRTSSTGYGPGMPASNFARHSFYSIRDRITLSS